MLGRNPKNVEKMMKKLNIQTDDIDAEQVIIKTRDGNLVIDNPQVMKMNMMGREVYQITGDVKKGGGEKEKKKEEDVKLVMEQTGKDRDTVEAKLEEMNNDLAKVIMDLKEKD